MRNPCDFNVPGRVPLTLRNAPPGAPPLETAAQPR